MAKLNTKDEQLWLNRITKSLLWRAKYSFEHNWPIIDRFYRQDFEDNGANPRFNLIYIMGQTLIPNLVFQAPGIINTPLKPDMTYLASIWDSIDNNWLKASEMKDVAEQVVLSSYLHNTTAIQIGYDFTDEEKSIRDKIANERGHINRSRADNLPWLDFIPSHRFVTAIGTVSMRKCLWAAKLVSIPTRILKSQKGLKNVVSNSLPEEISRHESQTWSELDADKWTHFWEIHDAEKGEWMWLGTHGKFILPPQEDPLQVYGLPFEVVRFNKNVNSIFGTPDGEYIRTQHLEGDEVRMHSMYMRRFSLPKCIYDSRVIKPEDMNAMLSAEVAPAIPAELNEGGEDDLRKHIFAFTPPTSLLMHREYAKDLLNDAQLINGFGPNQMGTFAPGRRTKFEAALVESTNSTRLSFRRNMIAEMIAGHTRRANILISKYWNQEMVQQVVGVDGAIYWVKVNPEAISSMYAGISTDVNVESLAPVSRERRKMEAINLLGLIGNIQGAGINPMPIVKQLLSMYEWIDVRQVLPQMDGQYELQDWIQHQQKLMQDQSLGQRTAGNLQGIQSLSEKLPPEVAANPGERANTMQNNMEVDNG